MRFFVTGGAGFIGRHFVNSSLLKNHEVTIFDNFSNSSLNDLKEFEEKGVLVVDGDITNYELLKKTMKKKTYDAVIHLAANISVIDSIKFPDITHNNNATGTLVVLRACLANNVKKIITSSSVAVYGNSSKLPLEETLTTNPISSYGASKVSLESYLQAFCNSYDLEGVSLRFANVFGKGQSSAYAGVISKFLENLKSKKSLIIYGDGTNTRDFVYVADVISAIEKAIENIQGKRGDCYNIGTGKSTTINDLAESILEISGSNCDIVYKEPIKGEIKHSEISIEAAKKEFGYVPEYNIKQGLEKLVQSDV